MRHTGSLFAIFAFLIFFVPSQANAQLIQTIAGGLNDPFGLAVDSAGNIYIADTYNEYIRVVNTGTKAITVANVTIQAGSIGIVAGNGTSGYSGDNGQATNAQIYNPIGVAVDGSGNIYIADLYNFRVRKVNSSGIITTVTGNGTQNFGGDNGPAVNATLYPYAIAVDKNGILYISDTYNQRIRVVNAGTKAITLAGVTIQPGYINTVAGNGLTGTSGDNGSATSAEFSDPYGLAVDSSGNIYICDTYSRRIRVVNTGTSPITVATQTIPAGFITTVAGNGSYGFRGEGNLATNAEFADPDSVAVDSAGNIYVSDTENERIRMVNNATGLISTIAGNGIYGYNGDGIPATTAWISYPRVVVPDAVGNVFFVDEPNLRVREIAVNPGVPAITSRAGTAFTVGVAGTFTVTTADLPVSSLKVGTLPSWLTFVDNGNGTGTLSGMPSTTAGSPFNITFTATNGLSPAAVQNFTVTVYAPGGAPSASLVSEDSTTNGFWQGKYGVDGYSLANSVQSIPAYATFTVQNQKNYTWLTNTTNPRALQIPGGGTIAAAWYNNSSFYFDLNLIDGGTHQFAIYAVDWDSQNRVETIQVLDANSGAALDTETISNFASSGVYLVWNIKGHVQILITPMGPGANGVVNGVFFGGQGSSSTPSLSITKTHTGNFAQGQQNATYIVSVSNAAVALPTSGTVTVTETVPSGLSLVSMSGSGWTCAASSCNRSDPLNAGASYPTITVTVNVSATAGSPQVNQVGVSGGGSASANTSDSTTILATTGGLASATFVGSDPNTQGNWISSKAYGTDGYSLANSVVSPPTYATGFNTQALTGWTWAPSSSDPRALQTDGNGDRIAAAWYNPGSFNFDVNITDGKTHQVALYVMDWDNQGRVETVQVLDASSKATLDTRTIPNSNSSTTSANFSGGTYLIWTISGHATITVSTNGGPNAVVSGIFFGGAAAPETVTAASGTPQSAGVGTTFASLLATVASGGSPVSGVQVLFTAPSLGASGAFSGSNNTAMVTTNAQGVATAPTFTANATAGGPYSVTATVTGASTAANFLLTNVSLSGPPASVTATNGNQQSTNVNAAFTTQLQATVTDSLNNPVPNVSVAFLAPSNGASGTFAGSGNTATATTNAQGVATAPVFTANSSVGGPYTVTATVAGVSNAADFSLTNTQAPGCVGNCASFLSKDTNTEGNWRPVYGADGCSLANAAQSIPGYATFAVQNQMNWTWASNTSDARALQIPGGGTIAATWYNAPSYSFDVNVGGSAHQFALYAVDWDGLGRSETIQIQDGTTGAPLDTETMSGFGNGVYLVWNITGHVKIVVTSTAGPNAVVSGVFFGGAPKPAAASFVQLDTATRGAWSTNYGADGYSLATVNFPSIPGYANVQVQNAVTYSWNPATNDPRALQIPGGSGGVAATWYNAGAFSFAVNFTDGATHELALYALDWTNSGRSEMVQVVDATTNISLDSETITNFSDGVYLVWNISGNVRIIVTSTSGPNGVVSGVFFGGAPSTAGATPLPRDGATQGVWPAKYGADGYSLAGLTAQKIPGYASFQVENATTYTWTSGTSDPRAVEIPGGSTGIAAAWYATSTFSFDVNVDTSPHPFELYLLDWDSQGRMESVQIVDAITNKQLDMQAVSNFSNGIYLAWTITGHVKINITLTGGPNAVASGVFFD